MINGKLVVDVPDEYAWEDSKRSMEQATRKIKEDYRKMQRRQKNERRTD